MRNCICNTTFYTYKISNPKMESYFSLPNNTKYQVAS